MRFCFLCDKPMFTSNCSVWIAKKNYPIHKKCKAKKEMNKEVKV